MNDLCILKKSEERVFWLDAARAFAIISISMNHALNRTFDFSNNLAEFSALPLYLSIFKAFMNIVSRLGVPIFLMITGSLLLTRVLQRTKRRISSIDTIGSACLLLLRYGISLCISTDQQLPILFYAHKDLLLRCCA